MKNSRCVNSWLKKCHGFMYKCRVSIDVQLSPAFITSVQTLPVCHSAPSPFCPLSLAYQWNSTVCTVKPTAILIRMSEIDIYIKLYICNISGLPVFWGGFFGYGIDAVLYADYKGHL